LKDNTGKFEADAGLVHAIVHGPATGAGSTVTTEGGEVKTMARVAADFALSVGVYPTVSAGLAATVSGNYFNVLAADASDYIILYQNNAGTAVEARRYPSLEYFGARLKDLAALGSDAVPLVVDDAENVALWLLNGMLGAAGVDPTLLAAIRSQLGGSVLETTPADWPPFVIYAGDNQRVILAVDDQGKASFYGATPNAAPAGGGSSTSTAATPLATGGAGLYMWRARIASALAGAAIAKFVLTGDSWTEHYVGGPAKPLAQSLWDTYGQSGQGWISLHADESGATSQLLNDATLVKSSGWTLLDMNATHSNALDGHAASATGTSATITISNLKAQSVTWYYKDGDGTFRYAVDGGAAVTVAGGNTGQRKSITISGLADVPHGIVFDLVGNAGTVVMYGGYCTRTAKGVEFSKAGNGGSTAAQWAALSPFVQAWAAELKPDVVTIILGTNDSRFSVQPAAFRADLKTLVNAWRAGSPDTGIVLVAPPPSGGAASVSLLAGYRDAMHGISTEVPGVEFLSLHDFMPGYEVMNKYGMWRDTLHLSDAGGRFVPGLLMKHFFKTN